jgi:hypothetical protein
MTKLFIVSFILLMCSCTKYSAKVQTPTNKKIRIEFCSVNNNVNLGGITIQDNWHIYNNQIDTVFGNNTANAVVLLDSCSLNVKHYTIHSSNNLPNTIYDSTFKINVSKTYSIITIQQHPKNGGYTFCPMFIEENDFNVASNGFAKIRFIVGVPTVGPSEYSKDYAQMKPNVVLTSSQYQIDLSAQGRYSLDNLVNPSLLNFIIIPAGNYIQTAVMPSMPGLDYTFESGKKYTVLITRMARTQYPENDNLKVIEHSF